MENISRTMPPMKSASLTKQDIEMSKLAIQAEIQRLTMELQKLFEKIEYLGV